MKTFKEFCIIEEKRRRKRRKKKKNYRKLHRYPYYGYWGPGFYEYGLGASGEGGGGE